MAVIQKIRDKYAKLAGGVIVVALLGFIFTDFAKGGGKAKTTVGNINGEKINYNEFQAAFEQREAQAKQQNPQANLNDDSRAQLRDEAWEQLVNDKLLADVESKLGITVTKAEVKDLFTGSNPDPAVRQAFTNPQTGIFNPQEVAAQIEQLRKTKEPAQKAAWESFESGIIKARHTNKFNALVTGAIYTPKFVLDDVNNGRNEIARINYVKLPYTAVPDADVKVSDDEIRKYMEAHKPMFTIKDSRRSLDYVVFHIVPSAADSARALGDLEKLKTEFAGTTDVEGFVNRNSQSQIPVAFYTKEQLKSLPNADELLAAPKGSIVGPFYDGQNFTIAKIEDQKTLPDSIKCRHILIATQAAEGKVALSDAQAKARIDSVAAMANGGVPFDSLVVHYSDDEGTKMKGGEMEFTLPNKAGLPAEFGDFIFEGHTGEKKVVKTNMGYHYIEILSQKAPTTTSKIAFVARPFSYSDSTNTALYNQASQFANQAKNATAFNQAAKAKGYQIGSADGVTPNSWMINGLGSSHDLSKWAGDAKIGDVSTVYTIGDKYVVAKLSGILDAGMAPINDKTRPFLEPYVKRIKKAEILKNKTKGQNSLEAVAQAMGQQVGTADSVNFVQGFIPGVGQEPKVVGYSFNKAFKTNTMSPAIAGQEGVYYINVAGRTTLPAQPRNLDMERKMSDYQMKANAAQQVMAGLRDAAEVKDNRADF